MSRLVSPSCEVTSANIETMAQPEHVTKLITEIADMGNQFQSCIQNFEDCAQVTSIKSKLVVV